MTTDVITRDNQMNNMNEELDDKEFVRTNNTQFYSSTLQCHISPDFEICSIIGMFFSYFDGNNRLLILMQTKETVQDTSYGHNNRKEEERGQCKKVM